METALLTGLSTLAAAPVSAGLARAHTAKNRLLRILVGTPFVPDRNGRHGGSVYLGTYIEALARHAEVAVLSLQSDSDPAPGRHLCQALARFETVPHRQLRDLAGAARMAHRARMLQHWGLQRLPLLVAKHRSKAFARRLRALVADIQPDVVLLEQAVMAQYIPELRGTPTVFADHERGDPVPARVGFGGAGAARDAALWARYVRRCYPMATLVQALNTEDARHLSSLLGITVEVRPLIVPLPDETVDPGRAPARALFLGNYLHSPNTVAAIRLATDVWPLVRQRLPQAELWLAGLHPTAEVQALAGAGIRVVGAVDDLAAAFAQARTLLAPVFSGSGVRIKLLTAMAHGLPVVSNDLGLRGVDALPPAVQRAESNADLATAVLHHLENAAAAGAAGKSARQWAEQNLSPERVAIAQLARLAEIASGASAR